MYNINIVKGLSYMEKTRIWFYDNLKFILITFVVIGHFLIYTLSNDLSKGTFLFIYSFHMPLFVFVTGFFSKNIVNSNADKRLNKIFSYFILYMVFKVMLYVFVNFIYGEGYEFYVFCEQEAPWYLLACCMWIIITNVLKNVKSKYVFIVSIIIAIFLQLKCLY